VNISDFYNGHLILVQGTFISLLLALSIQVPLRMGVFSFAGSGSYAIGAYTTAILVSRHGWSTYPAIAAGVALPAVVGLLLAFLLQRLRGLYLGMATISFDLIITVVIDNGGSFTGGATGLYGAIASPTLTMTTIIVITVVVLVLLGWTERGRLGRRVEAVRADPELAGSVGVQVSRYRVAAFVVSGALGGLSGAIDILLRSTIAPANVGFDLITLALTMIIVGGARTWLGAVIGAIIFTWLPDILQIVGEWQAVVYGALVTLAAVWVPGGIVGVATDLVRAVAQRRLREATATQAAAASSDTPILATTSADPEHS
jgi:branched-chain amino acid transport system permease protein